MSFKLFLSSLMLGLLFFVPAKHMQASGTNEEEQRQEEIKDFIQIFSNLPEVLKSYILSYLVESGEEVRKKEKRFFTYCVPTFFERPSLYFPDSKDFIMQCIEEITPPLNNVRRYQPMLAIASLDFEEYCRRRKKGGMKMISFLTYQNESYEPLNSPTQYHYMSNRHFFPTSKPMCFLWVIKWNRYQAAPQKNLDEIGDKYDIYLIDVETKKIKFFPKISDYISTYFQNNGNYDEGDNDQFELNISRNNKFFAILDHNASQEGNSFILTVLDSESGAVVFTQKIFYKSQNLEHTAKKRKVETFSLDNRTDVLDDPNKFTVVEEPFLRPYFNKENMEVVILDVQGNKEKKLVATIPFPSKNYSLAHYFKSHGVCKSEEAVNNLLIE